MPRGNAPVACSVIGATIRFQVNGTLVQLVTASFNPLSTAAYDLTLP